MREEKEMEESAGSRELRRREMMATNVRQQDYYESLYQASAPAEGAAGTEEWTANRLTRAWNRLRLQLQGCASATGVDREVFDLHREWLGDLTGARVLDLGCYLGNELSLWMAGSAAEYVGVDLSTHAIAELDRQLRARGFTNARAVAMDFLANDWPDGYFDVVYAYSVLHHFADIDLALAEVRRVLKPGGIVVTMDPLATDPLNRLARSLYRPFQDDRDWEFPFRRATLRSFRRHFEIAELRGIQGMVKLAYPFLILPGLQPVGRALAARLRAWDARHTRSFGIPLYLSWQVTMKLRRREGRGAAAA